MANLNIRHRVTYVAQQPGSSRCWAACIAMLTGRRGPNAEAIVDDVVREARQLHVRIRLFWPGAGGLDETEGPQSLVAAYRLSSWPWPPLPGDPPAVPRDSPNAPTVPPDIFAAALRRGPAIALGRRLEPGPGQHTFHAVIIDGIQGDSTSVVRCDLHGQDPLPNGANFLRSVAGFQARFRVHNLLYRA